MKKFDLFGYDYQVISQTYQPDVVGVEIVSEVLITCKDSIDLGSTILLLQKKLIANKNKSERIERFRIIGREITITIINKGELRI